MDRRRLRLLQQAHRQRLRLQRAVQHADLCSRCRGTTRGSTASRVGSTWSSTAGFSAFVVMAHTNAIFSPPGVGGVLLRRRRVTSASTTIRSSTPRRTCSTSSTRRTAPGPRSAGGTTRVWWPASVHVLDVRWRSRGDQQAAIGFFCGGVRGDARTSRSRAAHAGGGRDAG